MIRWYDYVLAILASDLILSFSIDSLTADNLLHNLLFGALAGIVYSIWINDYCTVRKRQERNAL